MADIIAVIGAPGAGQTTVAMKLAVEIYNALKNVSVCLISMDHIVPSIGLLFPNTRTNEIASAATLLDKTDMSAENVLKSLVTAPSMKNFGCIGLKAGENKYSYPIPDKSKIEALFNTLQKNFDFIIVDYAYNEEISKYGLSNADRVIRVVSPDVKSVTWLASNKHLVLDSDNRLLNVVNITDKESCIPTEEVCTSLKNVATVLPYSKLIRQQTLDGELWSPGKEKAYGKKMQVLIEKTLDPSGKGRDSKAEAIEESGFGS